MTNNDADEHATVPIRAAFSRTETVLIDSEFGEIEAFKHGVITRQIREFGNHTRPDFAFALSALDAGMDVFDLGCNIGTFALGAARKLKKGRRLLGVEGTEAACAIARRNLAASTNITATIIHAFVVGRDTSPDDVEINGVKLSTPADHDAERGGEKDIAPIVSIDRLMNEHFTPDFIKMDIEGAEFLALNDSSEFERVRPILYIEVSDDQLHHFGHSATMLETLLRDQLKYDFFVNIGERNARHDFYKIGRIENFIGYKKIFDVLCVPKECDKAKSLRRIAERVASRPS